MAVLTTTDGHQITFRATSVEAIADHDASTGEAVTCIYGVTDAVLHTNESVQAFINRVKLAAKLAQLTRPNGSPVWISGASVSSLRAPYPGEYVSGVNTVVFMDAIVQGVKESVQATTAALNAHGGDFG
jgi:hypothetical protein